MEACIGEKLRNPSPPLKNEGDVRVGRGPAAHLEIQGIDVLRSQNTHQNPEGIGVLSTTPKF